MKHHQPYYKKPEPLHKKDTTERQCIWEYWAFGKKDIVRCKNKASGRFFCDRHMAFASRIDSCSFDGFSLGSHTGGGYRI